MCGTVPYRVKGSLLYSKFYILNSKFYIPDSVFRLLSLQTHFINPISKG